MNRDTLIGIVGSLVLIAAMVGVFTYERTNAAAIVEAPEGPLAEVAGPTAEGTVDLGDSDVKVLTVDSTSAANVTFHLHWEATAGRDTLRMTAAPPGDTGLDPVASEPSDSGEVVLRIAIPAGVSPAGDWQVKVEFTDAQPDPLPGGVPPPTPPPNSTDQRVAYEVTTMLS